jgi:protein O-GlcNAc transferase
LGNALKEQHLLHDAIACYQQAIKLRPDFAIAHGNLGSCYYDLGDFTQAIKCFNYAIQLEPNFPDAYNNLGNALKEESRLDEAINSYRAALHLKPDHPHAYNNLGNAMIEKGFIKEAIHCYVTAIRLMPKFSAAHSNLGSVFEEQGKLDQAIAHYLEAIQIDPSFADAYCNLGNAYKEMGKIEEAFACYRNALQLEPQYVEAMVCLAATLKDTGRIVEAITWYRKALEYRSDCVEALANLVHANVLICDWRDREQDMQRLSEVLKQQLSAGSTANNMLSSSASSTSLINSTNNNNNNNNNNTSNRHPKGSRNLPAVQPFHCLVYPVSLQEMLFIAKRFAQHARLCVQLSDLPLSGYKHSHRNQHYSSAPNSALSNTSNHSSSIGTGSGTGSSVNNGTTSRRIRIGYVSSDFNNHPLSHLMESVFKYHDTRSFEVFCYALSASDGSHSRLLIENTVEHFLDVSTWHATDIARHIHDIDHIHILINLNGYTKYARNEIFALRPAPLQMSFLGFCGSLGAEYIQYIVCDKRVIPSEYRSYYSEKTLNLPHCYFVNSHRENAPREINNDLSSDDSIQLHLLHGNNNHNNSNLPSGPSSSSAASSSLPQLVSRARYHISEDAFVFCNFNQSYKIDPIIFACWMRILKRVGENAVLWLLRFPPAAESQLRHTARVHGIRDDKQLIFSDVAPRYEHLQRGYLADLCLDTMTCNAHTTAVDIL